MNLIDVHFHPTLPGMDQDIPALMKRAAESGVVGAIATGYDLTSSRRVLALSLEVPGIFPALGFHPWFLQETPDFTTLEALLASPGVVAIGEIGLDGKVEIPLSLQEAAFRNQLALAENLHLPVVIHSRYAVERTWDILREFPGLSGVMHSFSGGPEIAARFIDQGFKISFSGSITRTGAKRIHRLARALKASDLLLETDAPSIGLEGVPALEVEPRHLEIIGRALAHIRDEDPELLAQAILSNTREVFHLEDLNG